MQDIKSWMDAVRLKLNESKTELIYFGSHQQLAKYQHSSINIMVETIYRCTRVKYLEGHLNSNLLFKSHIKIKCKATMINIIRLCSIQKYLTKDTSHILMLLLPKKSINLMQHAQNTAERVILNMHTKDSATQYLKELHWIPIKQRIDYKICTIVFKALQKRHQSICKT